LAAWLSKGKNYRKQTDRGKLTLKKCDQLYTHLPYSHNVKKAFVQPISGLPTIRELMTRSAFAGNLIAGVLNDPVAAARNSPALLYSALRMRNEPLRRERSRSHAACPVCACAPALNVAIAASVTNRVSFT